MTKYKAGENEAGANRSGFRSRRTVDSACFQFGSQLLQKGSLKFFTVLFSCLLLFGCENDEAAIREWNEKRVLTEEAKNVTTLFSQQGRLKAYLTAPLMRRYTADTVYVEFPKKLHVDFYDSSGKKESELNALYGKYMEHANRVLLRDSVVVFNIKGDTLRTPELWWDQNTGKFYTEKNVRLRTVDKQIYGGRGLEADQDLSSWSIFKITGIVSVPEEMQVQ